MKIFPLLALLALIPAAANADAKVPKAPVVAMSGPASLCSKFAQADVARAVGQRIVDCDGSDTACQYRTYGGGTIVITRSPRANWTPSTAMHPVSGFGEHAYTDFYPETGWYATALTAKGVTDVAFNFKSTQATVLRVLRVTMNR